MSRINTVFAVHDPNKNPVRVFTRSLPCTAYWEASPGRGLGISRSSLVRETVEQMEAGETSTDLVSHADLEKIAFVIGPDPAPVSIKAVLHQDAAEYVATHDPLFAGVDGVRIVRDVPLLRVDAREARILAGVDNAEASQLRRARSTRRRRDPREVADQMIRGLQTMGRSSAARAAQRLADALYESRLDADFDQFTRMLNGMHAQLVAGSTELPDMSPTEQEQALDRFFGPNADRSND